MSPLFGYDGAISLEVEMSLRAVSTFFIVLVQVSTCFSGTPEILRPALAGLDEYRKIDHSISQLFEERARRLSAQSALEKSRGELEIARTLLNAEEKRIYDLSNNPYGLGQVNQKTLLELRWNYSQLEKQVSKDQRRLVGIRDSKAIDRDIVAAETSKAAIKARLGSSWYRVIPTKEEEAKLDQALAAHRDYIESSFVCREGASYPRFMNWVGERLSARDPGCTADLICQFPDFLLMLAGLAVPVASAVAGAGVNNGPEIKPSFIAAIPAILVGSSLVSYLICKSRLKEFDELKSNVEKIRETIR